MEDKKVQIQEFKDSKNATAFDEDIAENAFDMHVVPPLSQDNGSDHLIIHQGDE